LNDFLFKGNRAVAYVNIAPFTLLSKRAMSISMKHFIIITVVLLIAALGFFLIAPSQISEEQGLNPDKPFYAENAETLNLLESDIDAVELLKRCEAEGLPVQECVLSLRKNNIEVTGIASDKIRENGFQGLLIFPLKKGDTVIMDYNVADRSKQFLFFGTYDALKDAVDQGAMDHVSSANINSLKHIIKD
jgi:hypothetical protein